MKKITFLPIFIVATLILSACGTPKINTGTSTEQESEISEISEKKSLKELLGLGISQKCTFEIDNEDQMTKGELLINGNKFKQSMEIASEEGVMKINSISDGEYFYSWNEGVDGSGTKIKIEENTTTPDENMEEAENTIWEEKFDYKCTPISLSETDLTLPSDIEFVDLSEMMQNLENMSPEELQNLAPSEE